MRSVLLDRLSKGARAADTERGWGSTGAYGQRYAPESRKEFVEAYRDRVWANRCVKLIGTSSSQVGMEVRRGKKDWTDDHPMLDLFRRPCASNPALLFFQQSIEQAEVVGDWYWEVVPSLAGGIAELFPLRAHLVEVKPGENGPAGYVYDRNENGIEVLQYQAVDPANPTARGEGDEPIVVSGRYANPFDDYYGMSPMRAAKDAIISEYYAVRYDQKFFRNSARPDLIIGFKGKVDKEQQKMNEETWADFKGVDNAFRAALFGGDPDVTLLTQTQRDIEYADGRRVSREEQCAAFGVFPVLVADMTRATYNNFENAEPIFWKITMLPKLAFFASWANATILPFYPDIEEFRFNVAEVPALARAEGWRSDRVMKEVAGGLRTPDEGKETLGMEPSKEPGMDEHWMPTKSRPMSELLRAIPDPKLTEDGNPDPPPVKERPFLLEEKGVVETWLRNALEAKLRFAGLARTELTSHFAEQERAIMEILESQEKADEVEKLLLEFGWKESDDNFREIVEAMQAALADKAFEITASALGDHTPSEGLLDTTLKGLANRKDGIGSVSGRVKDEVIEQVREGLSHGLTYRQIAEGGTFTSGVAGEEGSVTIKGVSGVYDEYKTWQGERIARTEAAVTFNQSSAALMRDASITHVDIADGDSDEECGLANGSRWTLAEYEANPISHPNCTRIGLPVLETLEP